MNNKRQNSSKIIKNNNLNTKQNTNNEIKKYKNKKNDINSPDRDILEKKGKIKEIKKEKDDLKEKMEKQSKEIIDLKNENEKLKNLLNNNENKLQNNQNIKEKNVELETIINKLQNEKNNIIKNNKIKDEKKEEEYRNIMNINNKLKEEIKEKNNKIEELSRLLETCKKDYENKLTLKVEEFNKKITELEKKIIIKKETNYQKNEKERNNNNKIENPYELNLLNFEGEGKKNVINPDKKPIIFKNIYEDPSGNKNIEEEPFDINNYDCLPFSKILNNCKYKNYEWELFPKEIAANQLKQKVGNCYMVSALESLSHIPKLLNFIFDSNFNSKQNKFKINFRQNDGTFEHYIIKNNFPQKNEKLLFMEPLEKEAYAIIFEKVWAVIRGGFKYLDGGRASDVLNKVLGTSTKYKFNKRMGIFDINLNKYLKYKNKNNTKDYQDIEKKIQSIKESDRYWQKRIEGFDEQNKIDPKDAFESIKNAQKKEGGIITVSINIEKEGHEISVLGTYSKLNPLTNKIQDFIILKNPWRSGDDIIEKLDIIEIENKIKPFQEIIEINNKHYETGDFYMPREYFEKWFRDLTICIPNYKKYFPEVYDCLILYKVVAKYYKIKSNQYYFDVTQGNNLIKTDIVSKEKLESLKKLIQHNDSAFTYIYDKQTPSSIWYEGKYTESLSDSVFIKDKNSTEFTIKKKRSLIQNDFYTSQIYSNEINFYEEKGKTYSVISLKKVETLEELQELKSQHSNKSISMPKYFGDNIGIPLTNNYITKDLNLINRFTKEIREFLKDKYVFIERKDVAVRDGWINTFQGINLHSEEYNNGHYHVYSYGKDQNINLFNLIGKQFKCSCYYYENGKVKFYCNQYFTFKKTVVFYDFTYYINGVKKTTLPNKCDYYKLEKEKIQMINDQTNSFYINY